MIFISSVKSVISKHKLWKWLLDICLFGCVLGALGISAAASDRRVVKVAFFPMEGFHEMGEDGSCTGMDVEYLNALNEYTDWDIKYVSCDSWEDALRLLRDKKVDLVGAAQYSHERAQDFLYADLASGYTFGVVATNSDSKIAYEDFEAMRHCIFGMVKGYIRKDDFLQYARKNGIEHPTIREYDTTKEMQEALDAGKIDVFLHSFTEVKKGQRLLARFSPKPFYYITYKGNEDLMQELNQGIVDLKINRPQLETDLMNRFYYSRFDKATMLTLEESQYLENKKTLVIGYLDGFYPFSYEEDGEFKGLTRELLDSSLNITGIKLEYCKVASRQMARHMLCSGQIDILAYNTDTSRLLDSYRLKGVCEYSEVPLVIVTQKNRTVSSIHKLATVSFLTDKVGSMMQTNGLEIVTYGTQKECIEAVRKKEADAVFCDGYLAENLMRTRFTYGNLQIKNVLSSEYKVSMAIRREDDLLGSILGKTISQIDTKTVNEYMLKENPSTLTTLVQFLGNNSQWIIIGLLVVVVLVLIGANHIVRDGKQIQNLMYKDTKMDIWNLNYLIFWGEQRILPERRGSYALVDVNISQFRRYNVIYGWNAGEHLLELLAEILTKHMDRRTEICARNQGDRFVLLLNYTDRSAFTKRIQKLKERIEQTILEETDNRMLLQVGIYHIPDDVIDLRKAINYANQALDSAGTTPGTEMKTYDEKLEKQVKERHEKEKLLDDAKIDRDFVTFYQPKVDIRSGNIVGAEALVRFLNPAERGMVKSPGFFVPYYEQTGRITEIDFFVYECACKMIRRRLDQGLPVVTISCNFSRLHFIKSGFPEHFMEILEQYEIPKELIEVEITETILVEEMQSHNVKKTLEKLHELEIRLSIDDFGSGYSSLGIFEQIPASVIKLDRSFLLNQEDKDRQIKIMRGIVDLSESLNAQVVCEGVENVEDVYLMQEIGAYIAQGYFYSRPIPESEFEKKLAKNH